MSGRKMKVESNALPIQEMRPRGRRKNVRQNGEVNAREMVLRREPKLWRFS